VAEEVPPRPVRKKISARPNGPWSSLLRTGLGLLIDDDDDWPRFKTVLDAARYIEQAAAGF
jgi:hypothetical protein